MVDTTLIVGVPVIVISLGARSITLSAKIVVPVTVRIPISKTVPETTPVKTSVVPLTEAVVIVFVEPASILVSSAIKIIPTVVPSAVTSWLYI